MATTENGGRPSVSPTDYSSLEVRKRSFEGTCRWPHQTSPLQNSSRMADAGFYYLGAHDGVACFSCLIRLEKWRSTDEPLIEHARWSSKCSFIMQKMGHPFVDAVKRLHEHNTRGRISSDDVNMEMQPPTTPASQEDFSVWTYRKLYPNFAAPGAESQPLAAPVAQSHPLAVPGAHSQPLPVPGAQSQPLPVSGAQSPPLPLPGAQIPPLPVPGAQSQPLPVPGAHSQPLPVPGAQSQPLAIGLLVPPNMERPVFSSRRPLQEEDPRCQHCWRFHPEVKYRPCGCTRDVCVRCFVCPRRLRGLQYPLTCPQCGRPVISISSPNMLNEVLLLQAGAAPKRCDC